MNRRTRNAQLPGYLVIAPWDVIAHGGVNAVIENLVAQLRRHRRFAPVVLQNSWPDRKPRWSLVSGAPALSLRLRSPVDTRGAGAQWRAFALFVATFPARVWRIRQVLRHHQVRVVNIHYPTMTAVTFAWMKRFGLFTGRLILSFHGSDARNAVGMRGVRAWLWRDVLRQADAIIAVSAQLGGLIQAEFPATQGRVRTAHNGVDVEAYAAAARARAARVPGNRIISVASFDRVKGGDVLLRAIPAVLQRYPASVFVLVGESGTEDAALADLATKLGIDSCIEWHRNVPHAEIEQLLTQADIFVLPSRDEGLGLALLEAGAAALPAIATAVGGMPEVITNGVNGVLVPSEDPAALADAMLWMLEHRTQAAELGQCLNRSVTADFSWDATYRQYLQVLVSLGLAGGEDS